MCNFLFRVGLADKNCSEELEFPRKYPDVLQGLGYGFTADVWSAGILLYSMLSGLSAFAGNTDAQICWSVLHQQVDLESKPWPYVCSEGKDLVRR